MHTTLDSSLATPPHILDSVWPTLDAAVDTRTDFLIEFRRRLHAHPELAGEERDTSAMVAKALGDLGLAPQTGKDQLGVVVDIDLGAPDKSCIALRAELDCVGVPDEKNAPYRSTRTGCCHACGHDAHTAMVLTAASILHEHRDVLRSLGLNHTIRAIFQPAEEAAWGAKAMIEQGFLENTVGILALHVDPTLRAGTVGLRNGPITAGCRVFEISIQGRGGHTARPFETVDPIAAAVQLISQFYQLGPRSMDPRYPLALSVGAVQAGSAFNAIPDSAMVRGTVRTTRNIDMDAVCARMEAVVEGVSRSTGTTIDLDFHISIPATDNHPDLNAFFEDAVKRVASEESVQWIDAPSMGGEDFAYYEEKVPGAIIRLGTTSDDPGHRYPLHNSRFDLDESALPFGVKLLLHTALSTAMAFPSPEHT